RFPYATPVRHRSPLLPYNDALPIFLGPASLPIPGRIYSGQQNWCDCNHGSTAQHAPYRSPAEKKDAIHTVDCRLQRSVESVGLTDRKSTRLNSSHVKISYAVFCLKK